ncbi:metal-sulfur cluster assembly factor [Methanococcoides sp. AM1]|uniref:metal-sulfur cluster assembly factor n=1 Tax=Methanococcoides sp. AM1 TaxID=1201011 RepID=UPI0010833F4B|nr:metal-sulfur cluster assembly factor [Methanococcoides sp. AM1]
MITKEDVMKVLKKCYDPEIPINIVDLGLVYNVDVEGDQANIKMTLTTPSCPMYAVILDNVKQKVESIDGIKKAEIELVWDPPWTPDRISKEVKND